MKKYIQHIAKMQHATQQYLQKSVWWLVFIFHLILHNRFYLKADGKKKTEMKSYEFRYKYKLFAKTEKNNGIDISENMIHTAKMRYPNMNFEVKPCCPLEWSNESVNIITICCAFHHFDNPQGFINECKRVLKKNGTGL